MRSPSVLDYLLSLFHPDSRINLDEFFNEDKEKQKNYQPLTTSNPEWEFGGKWRSKWSILLMMGSALSAQLFLEPAFRNETFAIILYGICLYFCWKRLCIQAAKDEYQRNHSQWPVLKIKIFFFSLSIIFLLWAFIEFKKGIFDKTNVILWGAGILFFLLSILEKKSAYQKENNPKIIDWPMVGLGVLVFVLALFFRLYQLDTIPLEMFSDHAEKLLDVQDVLDGNYPVFFVRNTGREAIQFYLSAFIIKVFNTGINFFSLKLEMAIVGLLTLPFIFFLGRQLGGNWVGIIAAILAGVGYWPNVISRVGLRYALYPMFTAASIFFLIKGLQEKQRNDLVAAGLLVGVGLHGYSPFRIVPILVLLIFLLYTLDRNNHKFYSANFFNFTIIAFSAIVISIPLIRFALESPGIFSYRAITRLTGVEQAISDPMWIIFTKNLLKALIMFFYNNGVIWVHSIPNRPALDVVTAAFYFFGTIFLIFRLIRLRKWEDAALLISIPVLMMPSILSLAFPEENPSLNRTGGAYPIVFIISAIGFHAVIQNVLENISSKTYKTAVISFSLVLIGISAYQNYDLVFNQYAHQYAMNAWNTSEIGNVISGYWDKGYSPENTIVVPYPHWVDTRLVGICAGKPRTDFALWTEDFDELELKQGSKLIILKPEDNESINTLRDMYPGIKISRYYSRIPGKDFLILEASG